MLKRIAIGIISIVVVINSRGFYACASNLDEENDEKKELSDREIIDGTIDYLGCYDEKDIYSIKYTAITSDDDTKEVSIVYTDDTVIGELVKTIDSNGNNSEYFLIEKYNHKLDSVYEKSIIEDELDNYNITKKEKTIYSSTINTAQNGNSYDVVSKGAFDYFVSMFSKGRALKMPIIANSTTYCKGGQCWAACAASIANKYRGAYFNADSMYLAMKKNGYLVDGTENCIKGVFKYLKLRYSYHDGVFSYRDLIDEKSAAKMPIWCCLYNISLREGHAVLMCGVFQLYDCYGYIYMDPNSPDKYVVNYIKYNSDAHIEGSYCYMGPVCFDYCIGYYYNFKTY